MRTDVPHGRKGTKVADESLQSREVVRPSFVALTVMSPQVVGYTSSVILLATIVAQLMDQWRSGNSRGISKFLFPGQFLASSGFVVYSALVDDGVFIFTNASLAVAALCGMVLLRRQHRRQRRDAGARVPARSAAYGSLPFGTEE